MSQPRLGHDEVVVFIRDDRPKMQWVGVGGRRAGIDKAFNWCINNLTDRDNWFSILHHVDDAVFLEVYFSDNTCYEVFLKAYDKDVVPNDMGIDD